MRACGRLEEAAQRVAVWKRQRTKARGRSTPKLFAAPDTALLHMRHSAGVWGVSFVLVVPVTAPHNSFIF